MPKRQKANPSPSETYCTTAEQVVSAVAELVKHRYLIIDCEGEELGGEGGRLSLISFGTPSAQVYVFDAFVLSAEAFAPILKVTADPNIRKVVWDGRRDDIDLFERDGIGLLNVLDLQLVDVHVRKARLQLRLGEKAALVRYFRKGIDVKSSPRLYEGVRLVHGLADCLAVHKLSNVGSKDPTVKQLFEAGQTNLWMNRPLDSLLLNYAVTDIRLILAVYKYFSDTSALKGTELSKLLSQSARYVATHRGRPRPSKSDVFRQNAVLLMGSLHESSGPKYECSGCLRTLNAQCFEMLETDNFDLSAGKARRKRCRACYVIAAKLQLEDDGWVSH